VPAKQRNLIYTGITRGKKLVVLIGQKKALGIAIRNDPPAEAVVGAACQPAIPRRPSVRPTTAEGIERYDGSGWR